MKFSINNETLTWASQIATTIADKSASDIRGLGRLAADKNQLTISATNLLSSVQITVTCSVSSPGSVCLPIHLLAAIVKRMPASDIQIEQQEFRIIINSSESSLYELPGSAPEEFPEIEPPNDFSVDIPTGGFDQALAAVSHCVPRDSSRIWLNGVRIEPNDDGLIFSATDGHRLARYHLKNINLNPCWPIRGITVDIGPLNTALHCAVGTIRAAADDSSIWIDTGDTRWRIILRDDAWPDFNRILRSPTITPCQINGADLLSALRRLNLIVNKESHSIQIEHSSENLILRVINESGQGIERLSCSSSPEKIWACDIRYLIDAIGACPSQSIMLDVLDAENVIIISSPDVPEWISAIMPQRMD